MRDARPSKTAAWVAAARSGFGVTLPPGAKLCDDPYGLLFYPPLRPGLRATAMRPVYRAVVRGPLLPFVLWIQVRTRFLDDTLLNFVRGGGRQVVLLGAGFDCRAARFARELAQSVIYEVDHPATQRQKLDVLGQANATTGEARYVAMNFEKDAARDLPARLAALGHDPAQPTLTIWEGVTMYLTEPAIEATLAAVRAYSALRSRLAFTYFDFQRIKQRAAGLRAIVARQGEPWRFGWDPAVLPGWLDARGFKLLENPSEVELAQRYLPPRHAQRLKSVGRYIALAA